jgi:hypothetical protein
MNDLHVSNFPGCVSDHSEVTNVFYLLQMKAFFPLILAQMAVLNPLLPRKGRRGRLPRVQKRKPKRPKRVKRREKRMEIT